MTSPDTVSRLPWDAADPYPWYEARRRSGAVVWNDQAAAWLVLGYHPARQVLGGDGWTSSPLANPTTAPGLRALDPDVLRHNMLLTDGSDHRRLRGSVRDVFTRSSISGLRAGIEAIATAVVDAVPMATQFDLMTDIAQPLPNSVAAAWLGLDVASARALRRESPAVARMLGDAGDTGAAEAGMSALATLVTELLPQAADRRTHPRDDLLSFIGADPTLELDDVVITAIIIAVAGHETMANMLGLAMIRLLTSAQEDDANALADGWLTELLRLDGPLQAVARTATTDHAIAGVTIRAGEPALVVLAAANRDPAVFTAPDRFQPDRNGPAPLTFGYGAHYCLGAALARLELAVAIPKLLARRPEQCGAPTWRDTPAIRGPLTVPVAFRR